MRKLICTCWILFACLHKHNQVFAHAFNDRDFSTTHFINTETLRDTSKRTTQADLKDMSNYEYFLKPGEDPVKKINDNIFITVTTDKKEYYQNELVIATYRLYSRLVDESVIDQLPGNTGFFSFRIQQPTDMQEKVEYIDKKYYRVKTLHKVLLVPFATGKVEMNAISVNSTVQFIRQKKTAIANANSLDELINQIDEEESLPRVVQKVTVKGKPAFINVIPLPQTNKPKNFSGAVGKFILTDSLSEYTIPAGEMNKLVLTLSGTGYSPVIDTPKINWPAGFSIENIETIENYDEHTFYLDGMKKFIYYFSVEKEGDYSIPPTSFFYFDPLAGIYKELVTTSHLLHVSKRNGGTNSAVSADSPVNKNSLTSYMSSHLPVIVAVVTTMLLLFMVMLYYKKRNTQKINTVPSQPELAETASAAPPSPFAEARKYLSENNYPAYLLELERVLMHTISERFNIALTELSKKNIAGILHQYGYEHITEAVLQILNECETSLYMPDSNISNPSLLLERTEAVIAILSINNTDKNIS